MSPQPVPGGLVGGSAESYHIGSMIEGWAGDDYLMLFSTDEANAASERYGIADLLAGYRVIGLRSWDDFIVEDQNGDTSTLPTVPCDAGELARYHVPAIDNLVADDRFTGRVKWYITPVKFGGDAAARETSPGFRSSSMQTQFAGGMPYTVTWPARVMKRNDGSLDGPFFKSYSMAATRQTRNAGAASLRAIRGRTPVSAAYGMWVGFMMILDAILFG